MPPLPADFIHARACKLKCEKILTRPNPETIPEKASYWTQTQVELADIFQMFHLSANGLEAGMKCLLVRQ